MVHSAESTQSFSVAMYGNIPVRLTDRGEAGDDGSPSSAGSGVLAAPLP